MLRELPTKIWFYGTVQTPDGEYGDKEIHIFELDTETDRVTERVLPVDAALYKVSMGEDCVMGGKAYFTIRGERMNGLYSWEFGEETVEPFFEIKDAITKSLLFSLQDGSRLLFVYAYDTGGIQKYTVFR